LKPLITNQDYWAGLNIVPILSLGFVIMGMNYFSNAGIILKNKTKLLVIPTFIAALLNITLIYFSIPAFGYVGPAISTFLSQTVYVGLIAIISNKLMKINFEWTKVFLSVFIAILFFIIGEYLITQSVILIIVIRTFLLLLYPFILYKLNFFEAIEIERLIQLKEKVKKITRFGK
jgi:O-antigen/teichoic acid export membrane protein